MNGPMGHINTAVNCMMDGPMGHVNTAVDYMMDGPMSHVNTAVDCMMGPWAMSILNVGLGHFTCWHFKYWIGPLQMSDWVTSNLGLGQFKCQNSFGVGSGHFNYRHFKCQVGTLYLSG
jgi:hypothetical protein